MSYKTVKFIDREYDIPEDLLVYIDLLTITEEVKADIFRDFLRKLSNAESPCVSDDQMRGTIERQVSKFISKLTENDIYDRTVNDYIRENEGYKLISKVNSAALEEAKRVLKQQMSDWLEGYEDAIQKKDASVTGLGFSIWSGSFVNHAIYAAMEASKVNEQEKAAAKEYQKDMAELDARIESRKNADEKLYIANTYKPHMETAITVFAYELLDTFISDLIKYGKLDKTILDYTHIDRSNDLLKNLGLSQNKEAVLHKAFEACPYNLQVYSKALNYGLLNYDSYQTAQHFKQGNNILFSLVGNLGEVAYPSKFKIKYDVAEKIAEFTNSDVISVLHAKTKDYVSAVINTYHEVVQMLGNEEQCRKAIKGYSIEAILAGNDVAKKEATRRVKSIVDYNVWQQLVDKCGHANLLNKVAEFLHTNTTFANKNDVDSFLIGELERHLEFARQQLVPMANRKKQENETKEREKEAANIRWSQQCKRVHKICKIALPLLIIIPLLLRFVLVGIWCADVKSFVNDYVESQFEKELSDVDSRANEKGLTGEFKIDYIEYYKQEYIDSIIIVPHITTYSSYSNVSRNIDYWDIEGVFRYLNDRDVTKQIERPWYIANDEYPPDINFHITVIGEDGSKVTCYEFDDEDDTRFFVYLPFGTIIIFAVYSAAVIMGIKKIKKKYTVENPQT